MFVSLALFFFFFLALCFLLTAFALVVRTLVSPHSASTIRLVFLFLFYSPFYVSVFRPRRPFPSHSLALIPRQAEATQMHSGRTQVRHPNRKGILPVPGCTKLPIHELPPCNFALQCHWYWKSSSNSVASLWRWMLSPDKRFTANAMLLPASFSNTTTVCIHRVIHGYCNQFQHTLSLRFTAFVSIHFGGLTDKSN